MPGAAADPPAHASTGCGPREAVIAEQAAEPALRRVRTIAFEVPTGGAIAVGMLLWLVGVIVCFVISCRRVGEKRTFHDMIVRTRAVEVRTTSTSNR